MCGILCKVICFTPAFGIKEHKIMKINMVYLYDLYAPLLNERQREVLDLYYNEDQSLAEISENVGITRQGVRDCIVKSEILLKGFEAALGLRARLLSFNERVDSLVQEAERIGTDAEIVKKISGLKDKAY